MSETSFEYILPSERIRYIKSIVINGASPELYITFHLHYISFALHLKNLPCQHEMHATSRFKCHALHLHFMK